MKQLFFTIFLLCFAVGCDKESTNYSKFQSVANDPVLSKKSSEELLITELDDMSNLFPFKEQLDPQDPSNCVETIAKKQQQDFIRAQEDLKLEQNQKNY